MTQPSVSTAAAQSPFESTGSKAPSIPSKRSFASRFFGYDIFISFALGPPPRGTRSYASDLARRLRERDFNVFFSEQEAPPGEQLDSTLRRALLRSRTLVVIANRGTLQEPRWVRKEVEEFREYHPGRAVVVINVGGALEDQVLAQSAQEWLNYQGRIWLNETEEAVAQGIASDEVTERLAMAPAKARSNIKWRWVVRGVVISLSLMLITAVAAAYIAKIKAIEANRQRVAAEASLANMVATQAREDFTRGYEYSTRSLLASLYAVHLARTPHAESVFRELLYKTGGDVLAGHSRAVTGIAISADGRWLASASQDHKLIVWDLNRLPRAGVVLRKDLGELAHVAISEDGAWIAATDAERVLILQRSSTGEVQWLSPGIGPINAVFIAARLGELFAFSDDGSVARWRLNALSLPPQIIPTPEPGEFRHAAISPDERWLALSGQPGLFLQDLESEDLPRRLECGGRGPYRLRFSPDGDILAGIQSVDFNRTRVCAWSMEDLDAEPANEVVALEMSPDLEINWGFLLMLGIDGRIPMWFCLPPNCGKGKPLAVLGRDFLNKRCPEDNPSECGIWIRLAASRNGRWLAAAGGNGTIRLFPGWDIDREPKLIPPRDDGLLPRGILKPDEWKARPWSLDIRPDGSVVQRPKEAEVPAVMVSRNADWVAWVENDGRIAVWDLSDLSIARPLEARLNLSSPTLFGQAEFAVAMAPDKDILAACTQSGELSQWQLSAKGAQLIRSHTLPRLTGLFALALSQDAARAAIAESNGTIRILDLSSGNVKNLPAVPETLGRPTGIIFAPEGKLLYVNLESSNHSGTIAALNEKDVSGELKIIAESDLPFRDFAVSRDGKWLAVSEDSGEVRVWSRSTPTEKSYRLPRAGGWNSRIAFDAEGRALAIVNKDRLLLWNFQDYSEALRLSLADTKLSGGLHLDQGGHSVAVGRKGGGVVLWKLALESLATDACRTAGRDLTDDERRLYFGGVSLRRACDSLKR